MWVKPPWLVWAEKELGTAEVVGVADNPRILKYWDIAGLDAENPAHNELTSWCGAFVAACMIGSGGKAWGDASARSWGRPGAAVALPRPVYGCVGVKKRSGPNALVWQGHVGIVVAVSPDGNRVCMIAGNQGDKVSYGWFHIDDFLHEGNLGFRWPHDVTLPAVMDAPHIMPGSPVAVSEA